MGFGTANYTNTMKCIEKLIVRNTILRLMRNVTASTINAHYVKGRGERRGVFHWVAEPGDFGSCGVRAFVCGLGAVALF